MHPAERLSAWLTSASVKPAEFARRIDYDRSNFHRILNKTLWPSLEVALRIERETSAAIPMTAWAEAKEAA